MSCNDLYCDSANFSADIFLNPPPFTLSDASSHYDHYDDYIIEEDKRVHSDVDLLSQWLDERPVYNEFNFDSNYDHFNPNFDDFPLFAGQPEQEPYFSDTYPFMTSNALLESPDSSSVVEDLAFHNMESVSSTLCSYTPSLESGKLSSDVQVFKSTMDSSKDAESSARKRKSKQNQVTSLSNSDQSLVKKRRGTIPTPQTPSQPSSDKGYESMSPNTSSSPDTISKSQTSLISQNDNESTSPALSTITSNGPVMKAIDNMITKYSKSEVSLTQEEKSALQAAGLPIPTTLPLTKNEQQALKDVRRRLKNKQAAFDNRKKKKEYVQELEIKLNDYENQILLLQEKLNQSEHENTKLLYEISHVKSNSNYSNNNGNNNNNNNNNNNDNNNNNNNINNNKNNNNNNNNDNNNNNINNNKKILNQKVPFHTGTCLLMFFAFFGLFGAWLNLPSDYYFAKSISSIGGPLDYSTTMRSRILQETPEYEQSAMESIWSSHFIYEFVNCTIQFLSDTFTPNFRINYLSILNIDENRLSCHNDSCLSE